MSEIITPDESLVALAEAMLDIPANVAEAVAAYPGRPDELPESKAMFDEVGHMLRRVVKANEGRILAAATGEVYPAEVICEAVAVSSTGLLDAIAALSQDQRHELARMMADDDVVLYRRLGEVIRSML